MIRGGAIGSFSLFPAKGIGTIYSLIFRGVISSVSESKNQFTNLQVIFYLLSWPKCCNSLDGKYRIIFAIAQCYKRGQNIGDGEAEDNWVAEFPRGLCG